MNNQEILDDAPEGATHYDGKTYFRFEMYEHGQAYLILKNGVWDRGLPAYPVFGCHSLEDIRRIVELESQLDGASQCFENMGPITASAESTQYGGSDVRMKNTPQWDEVASVVEKIKTTEQVNIEKLASAVWSITNALGPQQLGHGTYELIRKWLEDL